MNKHLTLDDRLEIQMGLKFGESFTAIAHHIDSDRTTVSLEKIPSDSVNLTPELLKK